MYEADDDCDEEGVLPVVLSDQHENEAEDEEECDQCDNAPHTHEHLDTTEVSYAQTKTINTSKSGGPFDVWTDPMSTFPSQKPNLTALKF